MPPWFSQCACTTIQRFSLGGWLPYLKKVEKLSIFSNDQNIFAPGDLQQGDEDDDQLLPGELDSGRSHGHCLGAFSQVDNRLGFSAKFLDMLVSLVFVTLIVTRSVGDLWFRISVSSGLANLFFFY